MRMRILGCAGGIGGSHRRTTSFLVDEDVLIDCGTGIGDLSIAELARIDHVFLTHSHLDHTACLPLLIDTVGDLRAAPLIVHATEATSALLRAHMFNGAMWPDFAKIPSPVAPYLRYEALRVGEAVDLGGRRITALPANHTVPAVGYQLDSGEASLVYSGDTGPCPELWAAINRIDNLRHLIVETAFPDQLCCLAEISGHLCPTMLAEQLELLERPVEIHVSHLKPGQDEITMGEIEHAIGDLKPRMLRSGQVIEW